MAAPSSRVVLLLLAAAAAAGTHPGRGFARTHSNAPINSVTIKWGSTLVVTNTTPSCQVVVEPPMWPTSPIRETQLHWLSELGVEASPVFWQSWFVYPHSGVAQLQPGEWDFSQITPLLEDMINATQGRELAFQFGTVPQWMVAGPAGERRWDFGPEKWNDTLVWDYR
jgi:hypothetical protein